MNGNVAIIILNWNGWRDTIECLESVFNILYKNYNIILLDNSSTDESVKVICDYCTSKFGPGFYHLSYFLDDGSLGIKGYRTEDSKLIFIMNDKNYGFAEGNNIGIRYAMDNLDPDYILLLNNDTSVDENFLSYLVEIMESDRRIGIAQPKILKFDNPSIIDSTGHVFDLYHIIDRGNGKVDKGQYDKKTNIIGACGAAAFYRTEMLKQIGLLNTKYFMQYEDAELSWRAYRFGWSAKFVPMSLVYHKGGFLKNKKISTKRWLLSVRNVSIAVRIHGRVHQKFCFAFYLIYLGLYSQIGKLIGRNNIGYTPYLNGFKILFYPFKSEEDVYEGFDLW